MVFNYDFAKRLLNILVILYLTFLKENLRAWRLHEARQLEILLGIFLKYASSLMGEQFLFDISRAQEQHRVSGADIETGF